jgi:HSP20 family protein
MSRQTAIQTTNGNTIQTSNARPSSEQSNAWSYLPQIDVLEWNEEFTIVCDAPGLNAGEFNLTYENGHLHVHGPVASRYPQHVRFLRQEYGVGDFYRESPLGRLAEYVDVDRIGAEYDNGVLTIRLPKLAAAQPRKIDVKRRGE